MFMGREFSAFAEYLRSNATTEQIRGIIATETKVLELLEEAISVCDANDLVESSYLENAAFVPRMTIEIACRALP